MISASGLGKRFDRRWIFRNLSFEVGKGDRLAILGANGSGKSTLLKVLAGLSSPSSGQIQSQVGDPRTGLGYCAIEQSLYSYLTVREHLIFAARMRGCDARWEALLDSVGLRNASEVRAVELSTGMKSRLRFALATQSEPEVLLLDEPGASLDDSGRELVERIAEEQARRGCLIFASNDPSERRLANVELELGT